ncbi:hypothetical protein [Sphingobacterium thalpophilum]|uniref:hypothetical protein n=1 Tax=Sphingobacterium thalpophilum TaxID=259 RepID=UPI0024A745FD|nr:hypothetical protein [Sphingobacterium thalpophilum]
MPANKKYLSSPFQRFLKLTAGFFGGYFVMLYAHLCLTKIVDKTDVLITTYVTGFIAWGVLLLVAFLARNGWIIWGIYLILIAVFYSIFMYL